MADPPRIKGYQDLELIASGGFGSVYHAVTEHLGQQVAIKVLQGLDTTDPKQLDRFLREGRTMSEVANVPHVVTILEAKISEDGQPYLAMPFYGGGNLGQRLGADGPLPVDRVVEIGRVLADALGKVHRRGITHRDIKPENILLNEDGDVALTDFGLAVTTETRLVGDSRMMMTPAHAPPERLSTPDGQTADLVAADIYSLGSTLYTLVAGSPPFGTDAELGQLPFMRRVTEEPLPPFARPGVPPELYSVLATAMAKDPADRFTSATEMAEALSSVPKAPAVPDWKPAPVSSQPVASDGAGTIVVGKAAELPMPTAGNDVMQAPIASAPSSLSGGTIIVSQPAPAEPEHGGDGEGRSRSTGAIVAAIAGVILLVGVVAVLATRGRSSGESATTTTSSTTPVGTVVNNVTPPSASEVRLLSNGDLSFTWAYAPDTKGQPAVGYEVLVDNKRTGIGSVDADASGAAVNEHVLTAKDLGGTGTVDPAKHKYCVQLFLVLSTGTSPRSAPSCLASSAG